MSTPHLFYVTGKFLQAFFCLKSITLANILRFPLNTHNLMIPLLLSHNSTNLKLMVGVQVMYVINTLSGAYFPRVISKYCIILILEKHAAKLVIMVGFQFNNFIDKIAKDYIPRVVGEYGT